MGTDLTSIKAFAFDIDGVFTDGGMLCDLDGELFRTFDAKDSFGVRMAVMNHYPVAILTGGHSRSIVQRFLSCGLEEADIYLGSCDKLRDLDDFCRRKGLSPKDIVFMGDDLPDLPVIRAVGLGACPCDAVREVREAAAWVSPLPGGKGSVRHLIESVLQAQDRWIFRVDVYQSMY